MKRLSLLAIGCWLLTIGYAQQVIKVEKGNAKSLLDAVAQANKMNADKTAKQLFILIPDGFYDLGETVLTRITGYNIALIGQSMTGTIIQNKPDAKNEGISKTALGQSYFQDCEIHGTVDFICGDGDVWFEHCKIVTEKRSKDGSGRNVIAAPKTSKTLWGYIFNRCTVENIVSNFEYARGWNGTPHCAWLYTTLLTPEKLNKNRFDYRGMNTVQNDFKEFGTMDAQGRDITPQTNVVPYIMSKKKVDGDKEITTEQTCTDETILTAERAADYTIDIVFGSWRPDKIIKKMEKTTQKLMKRL